VPLRDLWPLLPEAAFAPLTSDALLPVLLFHSDDWPKLGGLPFGATLAWIPHQVRALYGDDQVRLKEHFSRSVTHVLGCYHQCDP
jgi:hypothetical protein